VMAEESTLKRPAKKMLLNESRALADLVTMLGPLTCSLFTDNQRVRSQCVMVIPGFRANDRCTWPLRKYLAQYGFRSTGWGLGTNKAGLDIPHKLADLHSRWAFDQRENYNGEAGVPMVIDRLLEQIDTVQLAPGESLSIIGWSLGGYMAREVARERPNLIKQIITLGAPVIGGPKYTWAVRHFLRRDHDLNWVEDSIAKRDQQNPISVPITALCSPSDGIVGYHATQDHHSLQVNHIEVDVAHLAFPFNRKIWRIVLDCLLDRETDQTH